MPRNELWKPGAFVSAMEAADICKLKLSVADMNEFQRVLIRKGYAIQKIPPKQGLLSKIFGRSRDARTRSTDV